MRTLKLTHLQIELITNALDASYNENSKIIKKLQKTLSKDITDTLLKGIKQYSFLSLSIRSGELDV